jgi:hypothetical protein
MRIAEFLRASFVGALLFSPAMADDVEKVHEEALRVLREKLGQANSDLPSPGGGNGGAYKAPAMQVDPQVAKERAERDARIKAEAQQRIAEREKLQAERRQQFEQFVKERERLRQQQHEYDLNAARQTGQIKPDDNPVHSQALLALHQAEAQPLVAGTVSTSGAPAAGAPITARTAENEVAPKLMAAAASNPPVEPAGANAAVEANDVHAKALEVLHQQVQNQSAPTNAPSVKTRTTSPPTSTLQPSPDLQRRLKQMQLELEQEELEKAKARGEVKPVTVPVAPAAQETIQAPDAYAKELEQRAQSMVQPSSAVAPAPGTTRAAPPASATATPGLDAATREMIRRQDQEISKKMATPAATATAPKTPAPPSTPLPQTLTPEQEAAAIAALHQQPTTTVQAATPPNSNPTPAPAPAKPSPASRTPVVTQRTETDASNVQYSKDLEERAREILLERAQNQQAATIRPITAPVAAPVENITPAAVQPTAPLAATNPGPAPAPAPTGIPAPVTTTTPAAISTAAPAADVHTQAQQTLEQIKAGTAPKTRMERLKEITDLYRADKMTPAEYHQKRAQILAEPQ